MSSDSLQRATAALERGDAVAAAAALDEAVVEFPDDPSVRCLAGVCAYQNGRVHQAKMRLAQAAALAPESWAPLLHLGDLFAAEGQPERAERYYAAAVAAAGDSLEPLEALCGFYQEQGLPYSAKQVARLLAERTGDPAHGALLAELEAAFPDRGVTLYVPCFNAAAHLPEVLAAAFAQSYPLTEVLVIDDGSTDDSVAVAARFPVRVITVGRNQGLAHARNVAIGAAKTEYLASLDSDVVADPQWLERLMLQFEAERLSTDTGLATLAGVMGRLSERHDVGLANQWRVVHCAQHHGDERLHDAPECYGCNGVWRRDVLIRVGGFDERYRANGEDSDLSQRVRALGCRLGYEPLARCSHMRRDTLESILNTAWRYHVPFHEHRFGIFDTAQVADVLHKTGENLSRHQQNLHTDSERRSWHLAYLTFLGLPWRMLSDLRLKARRAPESARAEVEETHAAFYLAMLALLADQGCRDDLVRLVWEDTASCRPADPRLAEFCAWPNAELTIEASRGVGPASPLRELERRDPDTVNGLLRALAGVWTAQDPIYWSMVRAAALAHRDEAAAEPADGPRVAVVNAPWIDGERIGVRAGSRWPFTQDARGQRTPAYLPFPFFLATAAAMAKREGFPTLIVDAIAEGLYAEEFANRLVGWRPEIVLLETATASHELDLDWALQLKERLGDVHVILCGPHATALGASLMDEAPHVDAVLLGEYEPVLVDLLTALREGRTPEGIAGLYWRDETGAVHAETARRKLAPIGGFPWPERIGLPMYNYFDSFANAMPWPNVQMHASRGCPYQCIFCVWPQVVYQGQNYRTRDNAEIVAEMSWLLDRYGFRAVYFDDDTFNIKNDRIIDLCERIAAAEPGVPICAMARADTSSREAFEAMARAGVVGLKFGVETGDAAMMERIRKGLDLERVRESVAWCKELGIGTHLTFSFGGPGETHETARKTIELACELDPDTVQFSLMTPFPGTVMFAEAKQRGTLLTEDWTQYDGARYTVVRGEHMTREELEATLCEAHQQWLLHLVAREVRRQRGLAWPVQTVRAAAGEIADLADGAAEVVALTTPLGGVLDPLGALREAGRKLAAGGVLVVLDTDGSALGSLDPSIVTRLVTTGLHQVTSCRGFGGEVATAFERRVPVAAPRTSRLHPTAW